jgi:hypothetical protein
MAPQVPSLSQERALRALRANRIFGTDEKPIRTENAVMNKNKNGTRGLSTIDAPRGQVLVRATFQSCKNQA